jgi:NADH-quinone oxidoreductase subunit M
VLVAAAFTLRAVQISFFGTTEGGVAPPGAKLAGAANTNPAVPPYAPITWAERAGAMLLIAATVYVGLKPDVLLQWISPALQSPLMQAALNGGAP